MEEIRVWSLSVEAGGKPQVAPIEPIAETATEQLLEEALTGHPELLMPNLRLIGRQNETAGGPLDLLGMDEDGRLVVFELKRGTLTREAVAQAIDYASFLADLEADELCRHIQANAGKGGTESISDFSKWYQNQYQRPVADIGPPRVVLVGLGADDRSKRMVAFLAKCDLDISLITFHGFRQGTQTLLARQVEIQARTGVASVKSTKQDNQAKLDHLLDALSLRSNYEALAHSLKNGLGATAYQWPNANGYSYYLQEVSASGGPTNRAYVALYASEKKKGQVQVLLQPRAVEALGQVKLAELAKSVGAKSEIKSTGTAEIWLNASVPSDTTTTMLATLGEVIATSWKAKLQNPEPPQAESVT